MVPTHGRGQVCNRSYGASGGILWQTIYEDMKDGVSTGHFRIEVQLKGKRLRGPFAALAPLRSPFRPSGFPGRSAQMTSKKGVKVRAVGCCST